jgi:hypothetical protein
MVDDHFSQVELTIDVPTAIHQYVSIPLTGQTCPTACTVYGSLGRASVPCIRDGE